MSRSASSRFICSTRKTHGKAINGDAPLNVYVDPAYRRQGIASRLYDAAEAAGYDVRSVSGTESLTPDGLAFVKSRAQAAPKAVTPEEAAAAADSPTIGTTSTGNVAPGQVYINWARIDGPDDVKAALQQMADARAADIEQARRGVRTHAETEAAAAQEDAWQILMQRRADGGGPPLNAEQSLDVRRLWAASADKLIEVARLAAANPSEANLFAFRKMLATHNLIQREVIAARTETARALESWKIPAGAHRTRMRALQDVLDRSGGPELHRELAARITALADNPRALDAFAERAGKATRMDAVREAYVGALLTNPTTQVVNTASDFATLAQQIYERWSAGRTGQLRAAADGVQPGEAAAMVHAIVPAFRDILRLGAREVFAESGVVDRTKVDVRENAIRGATFDLGDNALSRAFDLLGFALNLPMKLLGDVDMVFKAFAYRMEVHAQAVRRAATEGLQGDAYDRRVAELVEHPPEDIRLAGADFALYATYSDRASKLGQGLIRLRQAVPAATFVLPFIKTPDRILNYAPERSPLAPLFKGFREDLAAGGARRDLALARLGTGTMLLLTVADFADRGVITGAGPSDPGQRENLRRQGWQPFSFHIGDRYYAYPRVDPFGIQIATVASLVEAINGREVTALDADEPSALLAAGAGALAKSAISKTYLQSFAGFVQALADPDRYGENFLQSMLGSLLVPAGAAAIERAVDPQARDTNSVWDYIQSRIPGLSSRLPPRLDRWGYPVAPNSGLDATFDAFTPVRVSKAVDSPVDAELQRMGVGLTPPSKVMHFAGVPVDMHNWPEVWAEYQALAGHALQHPVWGMGAKDLLDAVVSGKHELSQLYRLRSDGGEADSKGEWIRGVVAEYRQLARDKIMTDPAYDERFREFRAFIHDRQAAARDKKMEALGVQ